MPDRLPWNRWICPRDKTIEFDANGYPGDPGSLYAAVVQPHCVVLESILDGRCGVVLGEAGIGKSDAMRQLESILNDRVRGSILKLDLGEYGHTSELSADLFSAPAFRVWQRGDSQLDLLLDSLDEGIAGVQNIVGLLQRRLRHLPFERLRLYFSCRTTAWPETFTGHLSECFGDEQAVTLYQLMPLLRSDVELAARAADIEPERFLEEIVEHNAQALASNPLTLRSLLNAFRSTGLPASSLEPLERGLLALCETPQVRRDRGTAPPYSAAQLLAVASRLAVICESLDRLAVSLHGELPARVNLWNELPGGTHRPKDEEHLSDTIARHLRSDLVDRGTVVNREVQIRRREAPRTAGGQPGQRTDIRVDVARSASDGGGMDVLTAVIEVKGGWNREVTTAMETQLVDRYLRENRCQSGVYLLGWYNCPAWDTSDPRQRQVSWETKEAAVGELQGLAARLTTVDRAPEVRAYVLDCALR